MSRGREGIVMRNQRSERLLPIVYLVFGIYFLNFGMGFMFVPDFVSSINKWIITFGGLLFFIAFYRAIVYSKRRLLRRVSRL